MVRAHINLIDKRRTILFVRCLFIRIGTGVREKERENKTHNYNDAKCSVWNFSFISLKDFINDSCRKFQYLAHGRRHTFIQKARQKKKKNDMKFSSNKKHVFNINSIYVIGN